MTVTIDPNNPYANSGRHIGLCATDGQKLYELDLVLFMVEETTSRRYKTRPRAILKAGLIVWDAMRARFTIAELQTMAGVCGATKIRGTVKQCRAHDAVGDYRTYVGRLEASYDTDERGFSVKPRLDNLRCRGVIRIGSCAGPEVLKVLEEVHGFTEASVVEVIEEYYNNWPK